MRTLRLTISPEAARLATAERLAKGGLPSCTCLLASILGQLDSGRWSVGYKTAYRFESKEEIILNHELQKIVYRFTAKIDLFDALEWFNKKYPNGFETEVQIKRRES